MQRVVDYCAFWPQIPPLYSKEDMKFIGKIPVLYLSSKSPIAIIYTHGNKSDLGKVTPRLNHFHEVLNVNIIAWELPGFGFNPSAANNIEKESYEDILKVYEWVREKKKIEKIFLWGHSMGTGPTSELAKIKCPKMKGVILQSPFLEMVSVYSSLLSWFIKLYPNRDKVAEIEVPVLLIHSKKDEVIPVEHSVALSQRIKNLWRVIILDEYKHCKIPQWVMISHVFSFISQQE